MLYWKVKKEKDAASLTSTQNCIKGIVFAWILWNRSLHSCQKTKALSLPGSFGTGHHTAVKRQRPCLCLDPLEQVTAQLSKDKGLVFAWILWNRSSHSCEKTKALSLPGSFGTGHHTAVKRQRPCPCLDPLEQVITQLWKDKGLVLAWILWNRSSHSCQKTKALSLPVSFGTGHCTAVKRQRPCPCLYPLEQVTAQLWSFGIGHHTAVILWNRSSHSCDPLEQVITQLWSFGTGHHTAVILWNRSSHSCQKTKALSLPGSFGTGHCTAVKRQRPCLCLYPLEQVITQLWKDKQTSHAHSPDTAVNYHWSPGYLCDCLCRGQDTNVSSTSTIQTVKATNVCPTSLQDLLKRVKTTNNLLFVLAVIWCHVYRLEPCSSDLKQIFSLLLNS